MVGVVVVVARVRQATVVAVVVMAVAVAADVVVVVVVTAKCKSAHGGSCAGNAGSCTHVLFLRRRRCLNCRRGRTNSMLGARLKFEPELLVFLSEHLFLPNWRLALWRLSTATATTPRR